MNIRKRMMLALGATPDNEESIEEMAIKDLSGDRATPKELAADIVFDSLRITGYWTSDNQWNTDGMTPKEKKAVQSQIDKYVQRIKKMLGY